MTHRLPVFAATGLLTLLMCGALHAQAEDYEGFPAHRVRIERPNPLVPPENPEDDPVNRNVHFAQTLYTENCVVLRKVDIEQRGSGMAISGEIFTDLDCDSVPVGEDLPRGQLMDLALTVQLYHFETMLRRDGNGRIKLPNVDPTEPGRPVQGQSQRVTIQDKVSDFGFTDFELPEMAAPLAPGIYQLVVTLNLPAQTPEIREAVKWVSEIYGAEIETVPEKDGNGDIIGWKDVHHEIMKDPDLHDRWHGELLNRTQTLEDSAEIWFGAIKQKNRVELIAPRDGNDRKPANYLLWTTHHESASQVMKAESELEEINEDWVERELEKFKNLDRKDGAAASPEAVARKEERLRSELRRVRRDNPDLISKFGGATTEAEQTMVLNATTARSEVIKQIATFQDFLIRRYWELLDGVLFYGGWHSVNVPCYRMFDAIQKGDPGTVEADLVDERRALEDAEGGEDGYLDRQRDAFANQPPGVRSEAVTYFRNKNLSNVWYPRKWVEKPKGADQYVIKQGDKDTFYHWRVDFIRGLIKKSNEVISDLDTTNWYANQVWPSMLENAKSAQDDVIALSFAWEYYIRTEVAGQQSEPLDREQKQRIAETVRADWEAENEARENQDLNLKQYYSSAEYDPSAIKRRFDGKVARMKKFLALPDFAHHYRRARESETESTNLPGYRPPTVPEKK